MTQLCNMEAISFICMQQKVTTLHRTPYRVPLFRFVFNILHGSCFSTSVYSTEHKPNFDHKKKNRKGLGERLTYGSDHPVSLSLQVLILNSLFLQLLILMPKAHPVCVCTPSIVVHCSAQRWSHMTVT